MSDSRFDSWLDAAGFDPDPDAALSGRAADELANDAVDPDDLGDPWSDLVAAPSGLSDAQRGFLVESSPALGAALCSGTLLADAPFSNVPAEAIDAVDGEIIDIDEPGDEGSIGDQPHDD